MGVDLQTYRSRIGGYSPGPRSYSVDPSPTRLSLYHPNILGILRLCVAFIGLLLLMAGIEPNPGPVRIEMWPDKYLTEKDLTKISQNIGKGMRSLGSALGLKKTELDHIENDHRLAVDQNFAVLYKWRNAERGKATARFLFTILNDLDGVTVDWHELEKEFSEDIMQLQFKDKMKSLLHCLGLNDKFPEKITLQDALMLKYSGNKTNGGTLQDAPWIMLSQFLSANCNARDTVPSKLLKLGEECLEFDLDDFFTNAPQTTKEGGEISTLDIFLALFVCCDVSVQQILVRKLYICNIAVPFMHHDMSSPLIKLTKWPLHTLTLLFDESSCYERFALTVETNVVTFTRFGRTTLSKSRLLNGIVYNGRSDCHFSTFFNHGCNTGWVKRKVTNGTADIFWLSPSSQENSFPAMTSLINMRGDLCSDFNSNFIDIIRNVSDVVVVMVNISDLVEYADIFANAVAKFSHVVIVIVGIVINDEKTLEAFKRLNYVSKELHCSLKFIRTNKGDTERRDIDIDIVASTMNAINNRLSYAIPVPMDKRLQKQHHCFIDCVNRMEYEAGHDMAYEVYLQMTKDVDRWKIDNGLRNDDVLNHCKEAITPSSYNYSKTICTNLRKLERTPELQESEKIESQILETRRTQIKCMSRSARLFLRFLTSETPEMVRYFFFGWLRIYIEESTTKYIKTLKEKRSDERKKYETLKSQKQSESEIQAQRLVVSGIDENIEKTVFGVEFFFREISHVCDSVLYLGKDGADFNLPSLDAIADVYVELILGGYSIELIDGDNFYMPELWIKHVMERLNIRTKNGMMMNISVLGIQSSGKTTLLNTMFGLHFPVGSGRCTRGIHGQVLKLRNENEMHDTYIMVVDSEGLRAPELLSVFETSNRDNEMATFMTGLGNVTLMNIMGENISDLRDILQIVVNALLRLKCANNALQEGQSCIMIHHNISNEKAVENMSKGFEKLVECLDMVTAEVANAEGFPNITLFNDVIKFSLDSNVVYVPTLWQGKLPLRRVNTEYSDVIKRIKSTLINEYMIKRTSSLRSIIDFSTHASDLWRGIIAENFVLSFRNRLEIKAYCKIIEQVNGVIFNIETSTRMAFTNYSQHTLSKCNSESTLSDKKILLIAKSDEFIRQFQEKATERIERLYLESEYKETVSKWKTEADGLVKLRCVELKVLLNTEAMTNIDNRSIEISTSVVTKGNKCLLRQTSVELSKVLRNKEGHVSQEFINKEFEHVWNMFEQKIRSQIQSLSEVNFEKIALDCILYDLFENDLYIVRKEIPRWKKDFSLTKLKGSLNMSGIDVNDISQTTCHDQFNLHFTKRELYNDVISKVDDALHSADVQLKTISTVAKSLNDFDLKMFFNGIKNKLDDLSTIMKYVSFKKSFLVKLYIHILRYSYKIFQKHNSDYEQEYGREAHIKRFKREIRISFNEDIENRKAEHKAAELFCLCLQHTVRKIVSGRLPTACEHILKARLPLAKYKLIRALCEDLAQREKFEAFIMYIQYPKEYAALWMKDQSDLILFDQGVYGQIATSEIEDISNHVSLTVKRCLLFFGSYKLVHIKDWFKHLNDLISEKLNFELEQTEFESFLILPPIEDLSSFTNIILGQISDSGTLKLKLKELVSEFVNESKATVKWTSRIPHEELLNKVWGCPERCPFCREPCAKQHRHLTQHYCSQHRPLGCKGLSDVKYNKIVGLVCNYCVRSRHYYLCAAVDFMCKCRRTNTPENQSRHPCKDYKDHFPRWEISPSSNVYQCANYWLWFIGKYRKQLGDYYQFDVSDVPNEWSKITKRKAIESLQELQ